MQLGEHVKNLAISVLIVSLALVGCKKGEEKKPEPAEPATPPVTEVKTETPPAPAPAPAAEADFVSVFARHAEPKPNDPVEVKFPSFKVVKATFEPSAIEGGSAEIEIDIAGLVTDDQKRTDHLKTDEYLDTAKFTKATAKIENVKKIDGNKYSADCSVSFRDRQKTYLVMFDVVETMADGIRVKLEHKFSRLDFGVGKDSPDPKIAGINPELELKALLTIKKS